MDEHVHERKRLRSPRVRSDPPCICLERVCCAIRHCAPSAIDLSSRLSSIHMTVTFLLVKQDLSHASVERIREIDSVLTTYPLKYFPNMTRCGTMLIAVTPRLPVSRFASQHILAVGTRQHLEGSAHTLYSCCLPGCSSSDQDISLI